MRKSGIAQVKVFINGKPVDNEAVAMVSVAQDLNEPDLCTAVLKNTRDVHHAVILHLGDSVQVDAAEVAGGEPKAIFKGEIVMLEPCYEAGGETHVLVHALNRLHRLSRGRKSRTFEKMTDGEIAKAISADYGLKCNVSGSVNIRHDHVYQRHETDLEFLRHRAERINYEIFVTGETLNFRERDITAGVAMEFQIGAQNSHRGKPMKKLKVRLSGAHQVTDVQVRSWDPKTSTEIIGKADKLRKKLGEKCGPSSASAVFAGGTHKASFDVPVGSKEYADAIARAKYEGSAMSYITGDAHCKGQPDVKAGTLILVHGADQRFDGVYYVLGVHHQYNHDHGHEGGYITKLKLARNAEGAANHEHEAEAA